MLSRYMKQVSCAAQNQNKLYPVPFQWLLDYDPMFGHVCVRLAGPTVKVSDTRPLLGNEVPIQPLQVYNWIQDSKHLSCPQLKLHFMST